MGRRVLVARFRRSAFYFAPLRGYGVCAPRFNYMDGETMYIVLGEFTDSSRLSPLTRSPPTSGRIRISTAVMGVPTLRPRRRACVLPIPSRYFRGMVAESPIFDARKARHTESNIGGVAEKR